MDTPIVLPIIDLSKCNGCGRCAALCPGRAVALRGGQAAIVRPHDCTYCDVCESYCPEGAIARPFQVVFGPRA